MFPIGIKKRNRTRDTKGNSNLRKIGFYGFSMAFPKALKKATEFNTSFHYLMPSGFDETIGCNTSKKTKVMKQGTMNILFSCSKRNC